MVIPEHTESEYESYPEYRDTCVEWLGKIPRHWQIRKLKHISSVKVSSVDKHTKEDEHPVFLCNYGNVYNNETILPTHEFMEATATKKEITTFLLKKDDVIVTKDSEDWKEIAVPSYVAADLSNVICGYHLALIRPNTPVIIGKFLFWAFCARSINHQFTIAATGITRFGLGTYWLDNSLFLVPSIQEQQAIAEFLDQETARIDEMIARKQRLIALLQKKRIALITRTVTKGLNPEAPMKDSGVEWLGEIPEHWDVTRIKHLALDGYRTFIDGDWIEAPYITTEGIRLIQTGNIGIGGYMEQGFRYISEDTFEALNCTEVIAGDILICRLAEPVGRACLAPNLNQRMITSVDVCILKSRESTDNRFIVYFLSCAKYLCWLEAICRGGTRSRISRSMLGSIAFPYPPIQEQQAIADFLDKETSRTDALASKINQAIERLQEYRSALITAAVTGKIDVRGEIVRYE